MPTSRLVLSGDIGGVAMNSTLVRTASGQIAQDPTLAAAAPGALSTRTSDTAGTFTMDSAGHGITDGDIVDIYWTGGRAYGATVGTVSGTSVPFTGAAGDVLPAQDTECTVSVRQELDVDFDGDLLAMLGVWCAARGRVEFHDAGGLELAIDLVASEAYFWDGDGDFANPLAADDITHVFASQASESTAAMRIGMLLDTEV